MVWDSPPDSPPHAAPASAWVQPWRSAERPSVAAAPAAPTDRDAPPTPPVQAADLIASFDARSADSRPQSWSAINCHQRYGAFAAWIRDGLHGSPLPDGRTQRFGRVPELLNGGRPAVELRVHEDDPLTAGAKRCELVAPPGPATGLPLREPVWFAVSLRVTDGRLTRGEDRLLFQWHANGFNPFVALLLQDGRLRLETRHHGPGQGDDRDATLSTPWRDRQEVSDGWMEFVVQARVSPDPEDQPFLRVWRNGELIVDRAAPLGYRSSALPYAKVGYYQWVNDNRWDRREAVRSVQIGRAVLVRDRGQRYRLEALQALLR